MLAIMQPHLDLGGGRWQRSEVAREVCAAARRMPRPRELTRRKLHHGAPHNLAGGIEQVDVDMQPRGVWITEATLDLTHEDGMIDRALQAGLA